MEAEQKKTLKPLCLTLRHLLEGRYDEQGNWHGGDLEERMNALGVWWDRDPIPAAKMPFRTPEDRHAREVIDAYLALREDAGVSRKDAIEEFVREAAYTWANRLLVLRCMEARDLIDGVVATKEVYGGRSLAHHRLAQRHPELCTGEDGGLFAMLDEAFSFHAKNLPLLFDPKAPAVALRPSVAALKKCIALLSGTESVNGNGPATDEVFAAPDALGWAYQYWNTEEKDRVFEKVRTKKAKIQGADIIPATQLYTEPYMVKFLVQNSLGATWMGMYPDSDLSAGWEYYVKDADRAPVRRKNVENITFLDPACGSGHFLLEAFDLFYQMYEAEGKYTDPATICKKILARNLYGIDIDERAVQIARAALWMKAAERVFDFSGTPKNIIATNIRLPKGKDHLKAFLAKHPEDAPLQPALETIFEGLAHADELGSLLQIEEPVEKELRWLRERLGGQTTLATGGLTGQTRFAGQMTDEDWDAWKDGVIERLADHFTAEAEAADLVNAFFSQNAGKGVRLFELLSKRYDVVAANPPYMHNRNMGKNLRDYLKIQYLNSSLDLYATFIQRCHLLLHKNGYSAMVVQQSFMFLNSYQKLRNEIRENYRLTTIAHLGARAFKEIIGEKVNTVLFCIQASNPIDSNALFYRLVNSTNKESDLLTLRDKYKYHINQSKFQLIPSEPWAYWLNDRIFALFGSCPHLSERIYFANRTKTSENQKYLRFFWEIKPKLAGNSNWPLYTKGGEYSKWDGNNHYCIKWDDATRNHFKESSDCRITDEKYWFRDGITYTDLCSKGFNARVLIPKAVYDVSGPALFDNINFIIVLGYLNTQIVDFFLKLLNPTMHVQSGDIEKLPFPRLKDIDAQRLAYATSKCIELKKKINSPNPIEFEFNYSSFNKNGVTDNVSKILVDEILNSAKISLFEIVINEIVNKALGLMTDDLYLIAQSGHKFPYHLSFIPGYEKIDQLISDQDFASNVPLTNVGAIIDEYPDSLVKAKYNIKHLFNDQSNLPVNNSNDVSESVIPADTFLEKLSVKLSINPISVYWLLKEGIEQEGWRCIPEERRITADRFTVMILRMLGHRWPKQIEAGEPVPDWADADGIIPLTSDTGEATLLERVRARIAAEFPGGSVAAIEREFEEVMGTSLEDWLNTGFFKHHTQQFKKRPIAWQVQSGKFTKKRRPAFACLVYYHKLDGDTLHKIKNQYVGPLRQRYETEIRGIEGIPAASRTEAQEQRFRELEGLITELKAFGETLTDVAENGFSSKTLEKIAKSEPLDSWCSIDGKRPAPADREAFLRQEKSYTPDINDGVRVNVAPLQKAGLLAADVIAKKDLEKAISDRAEWRADERRWCREGKLPKCGWWPQEEAP